MSNVLEKEEPRRARRGADNTLRDLNANELVFAVVGPVGSGTSWVAESLRGVLGNDTYDMEAQIIKASDVITAWGRTRGIAAESEVGAVEKVTQLQNYGDAMRKEDSAAVALELIASIKNKRDEGRSGIENVASIKPAEKKKGRAYILDSLKHPAEVELLRAIYQDSFCLIGVVCDEDSRRLRLQDQKCRTSSREKIEELMKRDEDDSTADHGQKVTDTFHLADFFVDNSPPRYLENDRLRPNPEWEVNDQLARLVDLITVGKLIRPTASETGMFNAYGAKMRSSCLSRQVGAALLDKSGNIISTGTNEVPRAGGGVYGGEFPDESGANPLLDDRCFTTKKYCSSNREQAEIILQIIKSIPELDAVVDKVALAKKLKKPAIGKLLEFSRAVHAEMDALLSAARKGATTVGSRLFVTTYPCHYCARHIVSAGVDEVQYIEPYPKSRALKLHGDAITASPRKIRIHSGTAELNYTAVRKVVFKPFTGVAPRLYRQVFLKDRSLKNSDGDFLIAQSQWAKGLMRLSYEDVEKSVLADREPI